ncbi:MAG: hypothetical protein U1A78_33745 [Polyangia bacterium]
MEERSLGGLVPVGTIGQNGQIMMDPRALMAMQGGGGGLPMQTFGGPGMVGGGGFPPGMQFIPMPMQTGGINWQALGGGLRLVAGTMQKQVLDVLQERAAVANKELEDARKESADALKALNVDPGNATLIGTALTKLAVVDEKGQAAFAAQTRLNAEQNRAQSYTALSGATDLAAAFSRQTVPVPIQALNGQGFPGGFPGYGGGFGGGQGMNPMTAGLIGGGVGLLAAHYLAPTSTVAKTSGT